MRQQILSEKSIIQNLDGAESYVNDIANLHTATSQLTTKWSYDQSVCIYFFDIW